MKYCIKCEEAKPVTEFYNMKSTTDGKDSYCKPCRKETSKQYNKDNRQKLNAYQNKYYAANKARIRETARLRKLKQENSV